MARNFDDLFSFAPGFVGLASGFEKGKEAAYFNIRAGTKAAAWAFDSEAGAAVPLDKGPAGIIVGMDGGILTFILTLPFSSEVISVKY